MTNQIIMLGAPGAGKGTQAEAIADRYNIKTISTGNLLREAVKKGTELGLKAQSFMESGQLVPDELVLKLLQDAIKDCSNGYILDGFPRTVPQALALEEMGVKIDKVIDIVVKDEEIAKRLSGRRVCEDCGASYHIEYKPTKVMDVCNKCGGKTVLRNDDKPETVLSRLAIYHKQTEPLEQFYVARGKLARVEGQEAVADTTALVFTALEA